MVFVEFARDFVLAFATSIFLAEWPQTVFQCTSEDRGC